VVISGRLFELRKSVINPSIPFLLLGVTVLVRGRDIVVPMRSARGGENDAIGTEGVEGPAVAIAWMGGGPASSARSTLLVLKGRCDAGDSEKPALPLSEEKRKDVFRGARGLETEGDGIGMGFVFRLRVLTREARGVEGREDSSSSSIERRLKERIPCFGAGVVVYSSGLDPRMVLMED